MLLNFLIVSSVVSGFHVTFRKKIFPFQDSILTHFFSFGFFSVISFLLWINLNIAAKRIQKQIA